MPSGPSADSTAPSAAPTTRAGFTQLVDGNGDTSPDRPRPPLIRKARSSKEEGTRSKSPFAGSVTELQTIGSKSVRLAMNSADPNRARNREPAADTSMSSAPVETLAMRKTHEILSTPLSGTLRLWRAIGEMLYPVRARTTAPPDVLLFLVVIGVVCAVFAFLLDITIDETNELRAQLLSRIDSTRNGTSSHGASHTAVARALAWVGWSVLLCWAAIFMTERLAVQAAGSGIPEMKSILSGGMKSQETSYLSVRTMTAKLIGLVLALGGGLPLGKEGPFVHVSCCLCSFLLRSMPCFASIRRSKPLRLQMLAVGCAVGVSSTFGAPIGGVLFSIEVTAQYAHLALKLAGAHAYRRYFLVKLYWRCFLAGISGAIVSRVLFSWWHPGSDERAEAGFSFVSTSMLRGGDFSSMLQTNSDIPVSTEQLLPYALIGVCSGLIGVAFVRLNSAWTRFRTSHAHKWVMRSRYLWPTLAIASWALISYPDGPFGRFMAKGQMESIDELFQDDLTADWDLPTGGVPLALVLYIFFRFAFLVFGITLPLPCGVFAPTLAIGAGIGRIVYEMLRPYRADPSSNEHAGGFAVLGAASMAAGSTRTISSAIIIFELTGGLDHVLPVIISVLIAYIVGEIYSVSIFDSILEAKGLITMPEFKHRSTYHKTARDVMLVRAHTKLVLESVVSSTYQGVPIHAKCFYVWRDLISRLKEDRTSFCAASREAHAVFVDMTYKEVERLLACSHKEDEYYPYLDSEGVLEGVLHRSQLVEACTRRRERWSQNFAAVRSQLGAASRAYGALERAVTRSPRGALGAAHKASLIGAAHSKAHSSGRRGCLSRQASAEYARTSTRHLQSGDAPSAATSGLRNDMPSGRVLMRADSQNVPFTSEIDMAIEDINSLVYLGKESLNTTLGRSTSWSGLSPAASDVGVCPTSDVACSTGVDVTPTSSGKGPTRVDSSNGAGSIRGNGASNGDGACCSDSACGVDDVGAASSVAIASCGRQRSDSIDSVSAASILSTIELSATCSSSTSTPMANGDQRETGPHASIDGVISLTHTVPDDVMPPNWMKVEIPRKEWDALGLDVAPFTVQASAPMHLVHFYFSQLTLNCVFVVDKGRFVGMINKADMVNSNF